MRDVMLLLLFRREHERGRKRSRRLSPCAGLLLLAKTCWYVVSERDATRAKIQLQFAQVLPCSDTVTARRSHAKQLSLLTSRHGRDKIAATVDACRRCNL